MPPISCTRYYLAEITSLCANVASAPEPSVFSVVVTACPPVALLLSVELLNQALKRHQVQARIDDTVPGKTLAVPSGEVGTPTGLLTLVEDGPVQRAEGQTVPAENLGKEGSVETRKSGNVEDDLLCGQAYRLDAEHWNHYQRPISADTLRRQLGIGAQRARALIGHVRQRRHPGMQVSVAAE